MLENNFLTKLLDGQKVEWKSLGEVCSYEQPTKYIVKSKEYNDKNKTPVLTAGKTFILGYTDEENGICKSSINPVIIFDDFTTANKWVDFDFKVKSSAMKILSSVDNDKFILKYIYYWISNLPKKIDDNDHKRQWIGTYSKKQIPIPCPENSAKSLEIQQKIVNILDKFTQLTAELTAELQNRKKQYSYYRDQLLTFNDDEVEWKSLGEVCEVLKGKQLNKTELLEVGEYPAYNGGVSYSGFTDKYNVKKNTTIISQGGASAGFVQFIKKDFWANAHCYYLKPNIKILSNKYVFYFVKNNQDKLTKCQFGAGIPALSASNIKQLEIPIPCPENSAKSLEIQQKIVNILDKFDSLTNSISEGLPREIELRQKQYEYYRDLLLNFPKEE